MALRRICNTSFLNIKLITKSQNIRCIRTSQNMRINNNLHIHRRFCVSPNDRTEEKRQDLFSNPLVDASQLNLSEFTETELENIKNVAALIPQDGEPRLLLSWICANCGSRCAKQCRKKSYYETLVIMRCDADDCRRWQLMSDHLHWFKDDSFEIQKLLQQNDETEDPQIKKKITDIINTVVARHKQTN
eukprot:UN11976